VRPEVWGNGRNPVWTGAVSISPISLQQPHILGGCVRQEKLPAEGICHGASVFWVIKIFSIILSIILTISDLVVRLILCKPCGHHNIYPVFTTLGIF
jgi:hypothetical protein